ncbi:MAG: phosphotransferase enzyme family protein [Eubacteriales bacterium]
MKEEYDFSRIYKEFAIDGEYKECVRFGEGHINDTFKLTVINCGKEVNYILQRINNRLFSDVEKLMHNVELVTDFCRKSVIANGGDSMRECLNIVRTREGKSYLCDGGNYFRAYIFIEDATTYQIVRDPKDFYESAVAFGKFAGLLADFDASQLYEVLPDFHNTKVRYANFIKAVKEDKCARAKEVAKEIEWVNDHNYLCGIIVDKLNSGEIPLRVTHNDTKLNNVMLDNKTGRGIAVIDLDTVMPGSLCYDFGDSIRFGCNPAAEDEPDITKVNFRYDLYETYLKGYLSAVGDCITYEERKNLPMGAVLMTYECGMRFLTDYLEGDTYFRTTRPGQNLDRAHTQFKLVGDMLKMYDKMTEDALNIK